MLRPTAKNVTPLDNYMLQVVFDNGETKLFDAKPFLSGSWYGMLKDPLYFRRVKTNGITIEWPDGQDICPDELYCSSQPIS